MPQDVQDGSETDSYSSIKGTDKSKVEPATSRRLQHLARRASVATEGSHEYIRVQDVSLHSPQDIAGDIACKARTKWRWNTNNISLRLNACAQTGMLNLLRGPDFNVACSLACSFKQTEGGSVARYTHVQRKP
jgi:hypothetical protein